MDEDGVYDAALFNDRMLLGLKGTMSEAELHILKSRLQGGILNKARRGELELPLPIGLVYTPDMRVVLDPDRQIQDTVRMLFDTFREVGSACAVVRRLASPFGAGRHVAHAVRIVASQARYFQPQHDPCVPHCDLGHQALKSIAVLRLCAGKAEVVSMTWTRSIGQPRATACATIEVVLNRGADCCRATAD
ncbi:hypothetical protein ACVINI_005800 [Rhizobium beringeri]